MYKIQSLGVCIL